jgi:hypothetical protein
VGLTGFQLYRREQAELQEKLKKEAENLQEQKTPGEEVTQPPAGNAGEETPTILRESQLKQMNKEELIAYATGLNLELQPEMKKDQMIEAILAHTTDKD